MRPPPAVLWTLLVLQVLDIVTTASGRRIGVPEGNPVVEWFLVWGGYAGFAMAKVMLILVAAMLLNRSWRGLGPWALHAVNALYVYVVASNVFALLAWPDWTEWAAAVTFAVAWPLLPRTVVPARPAQERFVEAHVRWAEYTAHERATWHS